MPTAPHTRRALLAGFLVLGTLLGCRAVDAAPAAKDLVPERYRFLTQGGVMDNPALRESMPFDRIELSTSNPLGGNGYTVVLWRDGSMTKNDVSVAPGTVSPVAYGQLCYLVERIGFESMNSRYAWNGTHATTMTVRVWRRAGEQPMSVEDYGGVGPPDLWTLRAAIVAVAAEVR